MKIMDEEDELREVGIIMCEDMHHLFSVKLKGKSADMACYWLGYLLIKAIITKNISNGRGDPESTVSEMVHLVNAIMEYHKEDLFNES